MNLNPTLNNYKIILASASPRRYELLKGLDLSFTVDTKNNADERWNEGMLHPEIPEFLAKQKSYGFHRDLEDDEIIITADTMVFCDNEILGKPKDEKEAFRMLRFLSGKTHKVYTGVCIRHNMKEASFTSISEVTFRELSDGEIGYYLQNYKPYDKAGAYGVQEWIGYIAISGIDGSYYNVMGLPVQQLYVELNRLVLEISSGI